MNESSSEFDSSSNKSNNELMEISDNEEVNNDNNGKKSVSKTKTIGKNNRKKNDQEKEKFKKFQFLNYFEAFKEKENYINNKRDDISKIDFEIEQYSNITSKLDKKFENSLKELSTEISIENINKINEGNLYELITEIIKINGNIFLYGLGSKLSLIYNFIQYFQDNVNNKEGNKEYYFLIYNLYNPELLLKKVLISIMEFLVDLMCKFINIEIKELKHIKPISFAEQIGIIEEYLELLENNHFKGKIIIILNNIDGPNFQNKNEQYYLSFLSKEKYINLITTCDNVNIVNLWTQEIKTRFNFYYLKFNTMIPYSIELNQSNSLTYEKTIRNGFGLTEIFESFSQNQKDLLKELANLQLKGDFEKMTPKGLVDYFIDEGLGICNNQNKLNELILEAKDHDIVSFKLSNKINKEIYKFEIENKFIEKISNGDFIFDKF